MPDTKTIALCAGSMKQCSPVASSFSADVDDSRPRLYSLRQSRPAAKSSRLARSGQSNESPERALHQSFHVMEYNYNTNSIRLTETLTRRVSRQRLVERAGGSRSRASSHRAPIPEIRQAIVALNTRFGGVWRCRCTRKLPSVVTQFSAIAFHFVSRDNKLALRTRALNTRAFP